MDQNLKFSGHETFVCKQFWLKKGFDFAIHEGSFNDPEAVSDLGVGKNMVSAINFWTKAFGIIDDSSKPTELGKFLFGKKPKDEFLEDIGSLWLLHYSLISLGRASIYNLVFNDFIRERIEFTKDQLNNYLKRKCYEVSDNLYNEGSISKDINVFIRNYLKPKRDGIKIEIEEDYSSLLLDLELISSKRVNNNEYFIPFTDYPIFMKATIEQIIDFKMLSPNQMYWKSLDCDIELSALENPQQFPLIYK